MHENEISGIIVDCALQIHTKLGPGLLESVYEAILEHELTKRGLGVVTQQPMPVIWETVQLDIGFRADMIKSVEAIEPVHPKQLRTYLRLMNLKLGLLINFNVPLIKDGITRVVNNL